MMPILTIGSPTLHPTMTLTPMENMTGPPVQSQWGLVQFFSVRGKSNSSVSIDLSSSEYSSSDSDSAMDSESDTESFAESGYCSAEENPDDEADYLRKLISQYAEEGPTMANHGENTKKMTRPELNRWNKNVDDFAELPNWTQKNL
ncbi:hypothetical protein VD0002_g7342 [Verticillium dahliae]|nr:hypothetical protein VD0003_g8294 [Verticillium dahliae]PNH60271.1 hypothetical protein VD0002_g7342 [Verticillium dahliae]